MDKRKDSNPENDIKKGNNILVGYEFTELFALDLYIKRKKERKFSPFSLFNKQGFGYVIPYIHFVLFDKMELPIG